MRVGYVSQLNLRGIDKRFSKVTEKLVNDSKDLKLDILIVSGGISNDYLITLKFVEDIGQLLDKEGIRFRFIIGNTDLYYKDDVVNKENKVRSILSMYQRSPYYLPYNAILTRKVRIIGAESWYDYTLYRGKPRDLREISSKKILMFENEDNTYITNASDYSLGLGNMFDIRYCKECAERLNAMLDSYNRKHGDCTYNVVVTYFKTSKTFLGNSFIEKYMGAFEGSTVYHELMKKHKVTNCVFGSPSKRKETLLDGIGYLNADNKIRVVNYDESN